MADINLIIAGTVINHSQSSADATRLLNATKPLMEWAVDGTGNAIEPTNKEVAQWIGRDFIGIQKARVVAHEKRVAAANDGVTEITATEA